LQAKSVVDEAKFQELLLAVSGKANAAEVPTIEQFEEIRNPKRARTSWTLFGGLASPARGGQSPARGGQSVASDVAADAHP